MCTYQWYTNDSLLFWPKWRALLRNAISCLLLDQTSFQIIQWTCCPKKVKIRSEFNVVAVQHYWGEASQDRQMGLSRAEERSGWRCQEGMLPLILSPEGVLHKFRLLLCQRRNKKFSYTWYSIKISQNSSPKIWIKIYLKNSSKKLKVPIFILRKIRRDQKNLTSI